MVTAAPLTTSWRDLSLFMGMMVSVVVGSIQLGTVRAHVEVNGQRLDRLELTNAMLIERMAKMEAQNTLQEQRLLVIEMHDTETRAIESRLLERLSKLEAR